MSEITPSKFTIVQSYGGLKEAVYEVNPCSATDTIDFTDYELVGSDIAIATMQTYIDGAAVPIILCETDDTVTVGAGPSAQLCMGTIKFRDY